MMKLFLSAIVCCFALLTLPLVAQDFDQVRESLQKLAPSSQPTPRVSGLGSGQTVNSPSLKSISGRLHFLEQSRALVAQGNYQSALQTIQNAIAAANTEAEKKLWQQLLEDIKAASQAQRDELTKKSDAFFDQLAKDVIKVKTDKELSDLQERLAEFRRELQPFHVSGPEYQRIQERLNSAQNFLRQYQNYITAKEEDLLGQQIAALNDLIRNISYNRLLSLDQLKQLRAEVRGQLQSHFERQLAAVHSQIKKAKNAQEFSAVKDTLNDLNNEYSRANISSYRDTISQMRQTINFAERILLQRQRANYSGMLYAIRNLRQNSSADLSILPDNWIDEQASVALNAVPAAYQKELKTVTKQIKAWQADPEASGSLLTFARLSEAYYNSLRGDMIRSDLRNFQKNLERLQALRDTINEDNSYRFDRNSAHTAIFQHPWQDITNAYYQQLVIEGAEKLYGLKDFGQQVKKGETATYALRRLAVEAAQAKKWDLCHQYLEVVHNATKTCQGRGEFENLWNATTFYQQAKLLQEAGQNDLAIATYQKVLSIPGEHLPRQEAIAAIKLLKADAAKDVNP